MDAGERAGDIKKGTWNARYDWILIASLDSLFGLKITVALQEINKIVFILTADHLNKF